MSTAAVSVSPAENSAASSATCRRWTAATPFSAHYALTACPLRFAHAMILYHRSSQTASALFSIFSGCMYFLECSPNTCSDSVFLFSHVYVSLARPWFRWALTIQAQKTLSCYLAAQKAAGTPVQVAYHLATPEVYATDPVDFDNTAGPLTVVTGGQVEVKMTDFVTDRTPAFLNKLDKTGDGSDVTVTFTEAATDTDIASGDKLSILFGKILKRFSTITSKFTTVDITDGTTVVAQANKVTNALVIMSNSGTALVNYDGSATANMTLSPSNVGAEPAFTKNTAFNRNFGESVDTVCQGNDSRLSNARRSSNISMSLYGTNLSISYS